MYCPVWWQPGVLLSLEPTLLLHPEIAEGLVLSGRGDISP